MESNPAPNDLGKIVGKASLDGIRLRDEDERTTSSAVNDDDEFFVICPALGVSFTCMFSADDLSTELMHPIRASIRYRSARAPT